MPIYGVLQRGLRFPRLGTIRKGIQAPVLNKTTHKPETYQDGTVKTYPKEVPYWVIHCDPTAQSALDAIYDIYGTREIAELHVFVPAPVPADNFDYWFEAYTASQLVARSDGQYLTWLSDTTTGETLVRDGKVLGQSSRPTSIAGQLVAGLAVGAQVPYEDGMVVAEARTSKEPITFKAVGRLQVVIAELGRMATWTVITSSLWYDIPKIASAIELLDQIARASGRPANTIPLLLRRVPIEVP